MSDLITNLNSILATKLEIKNILETESDVFAEYPALIQDAIAGGSVSGYAYITTNGDHNIASFEMVNVDVPVPSGYAYVFGTYQINQNGSEIDIKNFEYVNVDVPIPAGYIVPEGTYNITENGTFDVKTYETAYIDVAGEIPPGYTYVSGDYMSNISEWETVIDSENPSSMTVNLISPNVSEYETVTIGLQGWTEGPSYVYQNGLIEVNPLENGQYNSYIYVDVPTPVGNYMTDITDWTTYIIGEEGTSRTVNLVSPDVSTYETVTLGLDWMASAEATEITQNGLINVQPLENYQYNTYLMINVPSGGITPSGTYYVSQNGEYDITYYETVNVEVTQTLESYTWSGLTANGNPGIIISNNVAAQNGGSNLAVQVKTGSGWYSQTNYYQIISDKQFCYQLPTWVTGHKWSDYDRGSYILDSYGGTTYAWDPTTWDSLTDATQADTSSSKQNSYSYVITNPDVYYLSGNDGTTIHPWGGDVMWQRKITDFKINSIESLDGDDCITEIASVPVMSNGTDNHGVIIAETSYFEGPTDISNLAGKNWKIAVAEYQNRWSLMDIVGPVAGSETYLNEIDDVWANWDGGWNSGTTTYNSNTGCLELTYSKFVYKGSVQSSLNLYQLEYRLESGGSSRRIRVDADSVPTADLSNLSGTTYMSVVHKQGTSNPETNVLYIDSADLNGSSTYTGYQIDLKLCIPRDMWHYGSANHNTCWVEWTITPDDTPVTDDVTALQTAIGTSWYTGNRISGSGTSGTWSTLTTKSNKATSNLENYKIYEINITGTTSGTHYLVPDFGGSPEALDINSLARSIDVPLVDREDQNGQQMFTLDTTGLPGTASLEVSISVTDAVLDPDDSLYMTCHIDYQITY